MNVHRTETTPMELNKIVSNRNYQSIDDTDRAAEDSDAQQCEKLPPSRLDCLRFERPVTKWKLVSLLLLPTVIVAWIQAGSHGTGYIWSPQMQNQLVMTSSEAPGEVEDDSSDKAYLQTDLAPQKLMEVEQSDQLKSDADESNQTLIHIDPDGHLNSADIADGIGATADIITLIGNANDNAPFSTPATTMKFLTEFVGVVGDFIPFGSTIGSSLRLVSSLFGSSDQPDEFDMLRQDLNDGLAKIVSKLNDIVENMPGVIGLALCESTLDAHVDTYLNSFQAILDLVNSNKDSEVRQGFVALSLTCTTNESPITLLKLWMNIFTNRGGFQRCRQAILDDTNGRLFHFRREYLQKIVYEVMRAVEFHSICIGMVSGDAARNSVAERYVRDIGKGLREMEVEINAKMPIETIQENIPTPPNARVLLDELERDYSNEWSFGTFEFTGNSQSQFSIRNTYNNRVGKITYELNDRSIVVFYKDKKIRPRQTLTRDSWTNTGSSPLLCNRAMCEYQHTYRCGPFWNREDCHRCQTTHCSSAWHQLVENVARSSDSENLYRDRGVILVQLNRRLCRDVCAVPGCGGCCQYGSCTWRYTETGSVGDTYGDILTRFDIYERSMDTRDHQEGFNYALIGLTN